MLKGLDPVLGPDLLHVLAAMGHGDELVVADGNFPAASLARRLVRLDGVDAPRALRAILSVLPLDTFTRTPAAVMAVVGDPGAVPEPVREFQALVDSRRRTRGPARGAGALRLLRARPGRVRGGRHRRAPALREHPARQGRRPRPVSVGPIDPRETRALGRSAVRVTPLGFGGAPLGNLFRALDDRQAIDAVRQAWAAGVRYFDTAPLYGSGLSEQRIGAALAGEPRDAFVLSTKVGRRLVPRPAGVPPPESAYVDVPPLDPVFDYTAEATRVSLAGSLERLGIGRVDTVLIHDLGPVTHGADDARRYAEAMDGAYRVLHDLRAEGTIRAIGVGANEWEILERCARDGDFDCFLLAGRYSLLEQTALESFLPMCARRGIGVIVGGPYNSGILATGARRDTTYNYRPAPPSRARAGPGPRARGRRPRRPARRRRAPVSLPPSRRRRGDPRRAGRRGGGGEPSPSAPPDSPRALA